ncbi:MAG: APC family permease [Acidobacteria bacterium]|nr:APC family permease [Acidobacteriota bacterium]
MTHELNRVVGLPGGIACAVGVVVASSTLVMQGNGFGTGGPGFLMAMVLAMLINLFTMCSFAELSGMIPRAGSLNHYTQAALGPFVAIVAIIAVYIIPAILGLGVEASVAGIIVRDVFLDWMPVKGFAIALVLVFVVTNLRGIRWFNTIQIATAGFMIFSIAAAGIIGLLGLGSGTPVATSLGPFNPLGWGVLSLVAMAFWLFAGAEMVTALAEEIRRPELYIPLSMFLGLLIILAAGGLYGLASLKYVAAADLAGSTTPHIHMAAAMMGRTGQIWLSLASILASATTINTVLCALPRMLYGMAKKGQMPAVLGKVNRHQVPSGATYFIAFCILAPLVSGAATAATIVTYMLAATFTWVIGYVIAHVDLFILRARRPEIPGGFRTPLYPLPQLLSLAGLVWILFNISPDPALTRSVYTIAFAFLGVSVVYAYLWVRFKEKKGLFETTAIAELVEDFGEGQSVTKTPEPAQVLERSA